MKGFLKRVAKSTKNVLAISIIISALIYTAAMVFKLKLSKSFLYAAIICFIVGVFSIIGNIKMASSYKNLQAGSISSGGIYNNSIDNFKSRDKSFKFLVFMAFTGLILLIIAIVSGNYNL